MLVKLPGPAADDDPLDLLPGRAPARRPRRGGRLRAPRATARPVVTATDGAEGGGGVKGQDRHLSIRTLPVRLVDVTEGNDRARSREPVPAVLGPFDECDRAVEVRLEVAPLLGIEPGEAVQIEVRDGHRRVVAVADRERRARDRPCDAERARRAADEGRLPGAELAGDARPRRRQRAAAASRRRAPRSPAGEAVTVCIAPWWRLEDARVWTAASLDRPELNRLLRRRTATSAAVGGGSIASPSSSGIRREVLLEHLQHPGRVQRRRRMEDRIQRDRVAAEHDLLLAPVHLRDPGRLAREQLGGEVAERRDQASAGSARSA